jgi:hypothetical protein
MSSRLTLSILTAAVLSLAGGRNAYAASMWTNDQIDSAESGNPDSLDYGNRMTPSSPVTNDQINGAERGNPESPDYGTRPPLMPDGNTAAEWQSSESANPHRT